MSIEGVERQEEAAELQAKFLGWISAMDRISVVLDKLTQTLAGIKKEMEDVWE